MTLTMADDISAASLPPGYDAYAGYVDGQWPDFPAIVAKFPTAHLYSITVFGNLADEADCEPGDLTPAQAVAWAKPQISPSWRPGIYANASTMAAGVLPELQAAGVARVSVRLRSAHYGAGEHICGPATCGLVPVAMDGTQWTDSAPGVGGALIDASVLADSFFDVPEVPVIVIPGVPGQWLAVWYYVPDRIVVGQGTSGAPWAYKFANGQWTGAPV